MFRMEICYTCLSRDRILFPLSKFEGLIKETKVLITKSNNYMTGNICWECRHIMEKFIKFKMQVLKAQKLLKIHKFEELTSLSSLFVKTKHFFDTEYHYIPDPLTNSAINTETEELTIKQEDNNDIDILSLNITVDKVEIDDDYNQEPEISEEIYVETLDKRSVKQGDKKSVEFDDNGNRNDNILSLDRTDDEVDIHDDYDQKPEIIKEIYVGTLENKAVTQRKINRVKLDDKGNSNDNILSLDITVNKVEIDDEYDQKSENNEEIYVETLEKISEIQEKKKRLQLDDNILSLNLTDEKVDMDDDNAQNPVISEKIHVGTSENRLVTQAKKKRVKYNENDNRNDITDDKDDLNDGNDQKSEICTEIYDKTVKKRSVKQGKKKRVKFDDNANGNDNIRSLGRTDDKVNIDDNYYKKPEICVEISVETLGKKSVEQGKKGKLKVDKKKMENSNMLIEKFSTVVYTKEEVMNKRDEKRNQPNFKKLPYKCDLCVLGFVKKETYEEHLDKKHSESAGPIECDVCHIRFITVGSVTRHRSQHYVSYRCKFCPYRTSQMWSALNHCEVKHGSDTSGRLHCDQCDLVASSSEDLAEHKRTKHSLHCNECGEKFKGKNTLRTHKIRIHALKREFICDMCRKSFNSRSRLESHVSRHSAALAQRLSYCAHCRVQYNSVHVYRNHLRNSAHHARDQYPCPECNKKFASKVYLTKHHNFYHLHKSKYKCETCNKLFISNWRLKNHKQKHHGMSRSRDHACNICGKKFYTLSTLRGHILTHSEQRSYMCEDCGDTFKQRPALYTHHRLVHRTNKTT